MSFMISMHNIQRSKHKAGQIRIRLSKMRLSQENSHSRKLWIRYNYNLGVVFIGMGCFQYSISLLSSHVLICKCQTVNDKVTRGACNIRIPMVPIATFFLICSNLCNLKWNSERKMLCSQNLGQYLLQWPNQGYPDPAAWEPWEGLCAWRPALFTTSPSCSAKPINGPEVYARAKALFLKLRIWTKNSHVPLKKKKSPKEVGISFICTNAATMLLSQLLGGLPVSTAPSPFPQGLAQNRRQQKAQCLPQWVPMGRGPSASTRPLQEKGLSTPATHNSFQRGGQSSPLPDCQVAQRPSWSGHYLREQCQMTSPSTAQGRAPREGPRRTRSISRQQGHCMQEV